MQDNREQIMSSTASILDMLREEVPMQIELSATLQVTAKVVYDRRADMEKTIEHFEKKTPDSPDYEQAQATIKQLKQTLATIDRAKNGVFSESNISLDKDELRKRLHVIFGSYLAYLEDKDADGFKEAISIIEKGIKDSRRILSRVKKDFGVKDTKAKSAPAVEKAIATRAREFFAPADKIYRSLFDPSKTPTFYDKLKVIVEVGQKGGKPVRTFVSIDVDKLQGVTFSKGVMVDPFNRAIHNIAVSLYVAGNKHITPRMIYHALNGGVREKEVPEKLYDEIIESMRKLMLTSIKIDATEEAEKLGLDVLRLENYLLPVSVTAVAMNGQEVEAFTFMDEPPLYTYASKKKQISRCDIGLLAADISMTPENITIRDYLLDRVTSMKSKGSKLLNVIRYDTLYEYLGLTAPNSNALRQRKSDVRTKVRTILNAWVKAGFIEGYAEEFENRTAAKVRIAVAEKA